MTAGYARREGSGRANLLCRSNSDYQRPACFWQHWRERGGPAFACRLRRDESGPVEILQIFWPSIFTEKASAPIVHPLLIYAIFWAPVWRVTWRPHE
ncbi:MAG: hypothetical protein C4519_14565 [Desulfobacteraceae bacterium]|nr:MAG: hypothetical protein C4519_14565 [Desulfobacteraceae bacterium]